MFVCEQDHPQYTLPLPAHLEVEIGSKIGDEGHVLASRHVLHANGDPGHQIRVVQGFTWETGEGVLDERGGVLSSRDTIPTSNAQQHTIDEAVQAGHGLLRDEKVVPEKRMNDVWNDINERTQDTPRAAWQLSKTQCALHVRGRVTPLLFLLSLRHCQVVLGPRSGCRMRACVCVSEPSICRAS